MLGNDGYQRKREDSLRELDQTGKCEEYYVNIHVVGAGQITKKKIIMTDAAVPMLL
jgi:hypothetical protein